MLACPAGTTLRSYLSEKLHCDPMRITKKFAGDASIGKRVFTPCKQTPGAPGGSPTGASRAPGHGAALRGAFPARVAGLRRRLPLLKEGAAPGRSPRCTGGRASTRTAPSPSTTTGGCSSARGDRRRSSARATTRRASRRTPRTRSCCWTSSWRCASAARRAGPRPRRRRRRGRLPGWLRRRRRRRRRRGRARAPTAGPRPPTRRRRRRRTPSPARRRTAATRARRGRAPTLPNLDAPEAMRC